MNSGQIQLVTHQSPERQYRVDYCPISPLHSEFEIMEPETYLGKGGGGGRYLKGTFPLSRILIPFSLLFREGCKRQWLERIVEGKRL